MVYVALFKSAKDSKERSKEPTWLGWRKKVDVACRRQVEWQKGEKVPGTKNIMKIFVNSMFVICKYCALYAFRTQQLIDCGKEQFYL